MQQVKTLFKYAECDKGYHSVMVNDQDTFDSLLDNGWTDVFLDINKPAEVIEMSANERELRDRYEVLTGKKISGRAKIETIIKMVAEAEEA